VRRRRDDDRRQEALGERAGDRAVGRHLRAVRSLTRPSAPAPPGTGASPRPPRPTQRRCRCR
jgi:hypothetical protein